MKSYQKILAAAMAALMMTSCSDNNSSSGSDTDTSIVTETTVNAPIGDSKRNRSSGENRIAAALVVAVQSSGKLVYLPSAASL